MIEILLVWVYIFFTSYCIGRLIVDALTKGILRDGNDPLHPVVYSFCGLTVITVIGGYLSLLLPMKSAIHVIILSLCAVYLIIYKKKSGFRIDMPRSKSVVFWMACIAFAGLFLFFLIRTSGVITNPDSGEYQIPILKWIEQYKVVKGTANLHHRYGFNYQYLILCAIYGFAFLGIDTVHAMNGYVMCAFLVYLFSTMQFLRGRTWCISDFIRIIVILFVVQMNSAVSSFSPDFSVAAFIIMGILVLLDKMDAGTTTVYDPEALAMVFLLIGALIFKISAAASLIFLLFFMFPRGVGKKIKVIGLTFLLGLICVLPYLIRNYYISGYLIYPLYSIDWFHVKWKVPRHILVFAKEDVRSYGGLTLNKIGEVPFWSIIKTWLHKQRQLNITSLYLITGLFISTVASLVWLAVSIFRKKTSWLSQRAILLYMLYVCLVYWWVNAGDPRFGNGYIIPFIAITWVLIFKPIIDMRPKLMQYTGLVVVLLITGFLLSGSTFAKMSFDYETLYRKQHVRKVYLLSQAPYPIPDTTVNNDIEVPVYTVPADKGCWCTPQPCIKVKDLGHYRLLGTKVEDGFMPIADKWILK